MGFLPWKENGDLSEIQKTCWEWVGIWLVIIYQSQALFGGDLDGQRGAVGDSGSLFACRLRALFLLKGAALVWGSASHTM